MYIDLVEIYQVYEGSIILARAGNSIAKLTYAQIEYLGVEYRKICGFNKESFFNYYKDEAKEFYAKYPETNIEEFLLR